jgi:hypothetical protein
LLSAQAVKTDLALRQPAVAHRRILLALRKPLLEVLNLLAIALDECVRIDNFLLLRVQRDLLNALREQEGVR